MLAVLMGPAGRAGDEVAQLLVSERVPLLTAPKREDLRQDHWRLWQRGPVVVVLVDPKPEDWSAADWASDIVPHLPYGAGTVRSFERF